MPQPRLSCFAVLIAAALAATSLRAADNQLTLDDFQQLHKALNPPDEPWRKLPWHTSMLDACRQAAEEKKPVYMLCRSGHPLGCV